MPLRDIEGIAQREFLMLQSAGMATLRGVDGATQYGQTAKDQAATPSIIEPWILSMANDQTIEKVRPIYPRRSKRPLG